ncbi:hypothetical protein NPS01_01600 [Nocardioides psychrotolerans]|uniref:Secreted protein n=1 Tax=Nocardioides psychrotolerans TaxID=1005945 RepID=A0A1I3BQZ1_9ACTN|nr:hypothetical protein [Nocardioides psychrotolerans]GEP36497.1 hypothetical protein NPS01_01600 [Nocardioides psychrotolerans]SFH64692.1 hypothetical protein SAMN05216561_101280 [Nocardioides psychrotolerans]
MQALMRTVAGTTAGAIAGVAMVLSLLEVPGSPAGATGTEAADQVATSTRGDWQVRTTAPGRHLVSWTSPRRLPLTSDRPRVVPAPGMGADAAVIGVPTLSADGRTLTSVVSSPSAPDPADLDVVLSGRVLDEPRVAVARRGGGRAAATVPVKQTLAADPGVAGPHAVVTSDYTLDPVKLPGMPEPIEMLGHVVEPDPAAATGPRPLVLFLHGRHEVCYLPPGTEGDLGAWPCAAPALEIPSHLGYDYMQRLLATQGYASVSIRVNGINAQDFRLPDGGAGVRADIVREHLDHWVGIAAAHQVDLDRVVLVGHSRGGEGVDRASIRIPLDAPYRVVGQVLLAPTDFGVQSAPYVPTVTVLPYCDGDVSDLQGQKFTDLARDLTTDDTSLKSSVMVMGANHNFFNTEWTPATAVAPAVDDWSGADTEGCGRKSPDRLSPAGQHRAGRTVVAGAVRLFAGEQQFLPLYDGSTVTVDSLDGADLRSHAVGGGRDVRRPAAGTSPTLPVGATSQFCVGVAGFENRFGRCGRSLTDTVTPHWEADGARVPTRRFFEMAWTAVGQRAGLGLDRPLDLSTGRLELRTIVDDAGGDATFGVRLTDADGARAEVTPEGGGLVPALPSVPFGTKLWAQTLVVDPTVAAGIDLTRVTAVELVAGTPRGRVWVADLASAPVTLAAVPERRLPTLSLAGLRLVEGDASGTREARMPFRVTGEVSRPMKVEVVTVGQARGAVQSFTIDLAPGQTSGSVPVSYDVDRRDDLSPSVTTASIWATRNVMTDAYVADVRIEDDDPAPPVTVSPVSRTVREGERVEVVVRLGGTIDYDLFVQARVLRSPAGLRVADVPAAWFERYGYSEDPAATLASTRLSLYEQVRAGQRRVVVSVPIARDGVAEPRESITLRLVVGRQRFTRTIYVARSAGGSAAG